MGLLLFPRWLFWPLFWAVMGFAAGGSFVSATSEPIYQVTDSAKKQTAASKSSEREPDETTWHWLMHEAVGFFTFWLVIIAGGQLVLFLWQLWLIRESLDDAKIAADAAKESADTAKVQAEVAQATLKTMQNTAVRQLRAYVFLEHATFMFSESGRTYIDIALKNYGQTPAYEVVIKFESALTLRHPADFVIPFSERAEVLPNVVFAPAHRQIIHINRNEVSRMSWNVYRETGHFAYVWGRLDYKDAFDRARFTTFQLINNFTDAESFALCEKGNTAD